MADINHGYRFDGVITFNPDYDTLTRIFAQLRDLGGTQQLVFDNSTEPSAVELVTSMCREAGVAVLRSPTGNTGTAGGLNALLRAARHAGAEWLHYLDQDSITDPGYSDRLAETLQCESYDAIGCLHSSHTELRGSDPIATRYLISSGTAFRVSIAFRIGGFDESLFLDLVDTEFCLRLQYFGGRIVVDPRRSITHPIGEGARNVLGIQVTSHPTWRRRLMWRNTVHISRLYWRIAPGAVVRHLAGRVLETILTAAILRRLDVLGAAGKGLSAGILQSPDRTLLKACLTGDARDQQT